MADVVEEEVKIEKEDCGIRDGRSYGSWSHRMW